MKDENRFILIIIMAIIAILLLATCITYVSSLFSNISNENKIDNNNGESDIIIDSDDDILFIDETETIGTLYIPAIDMKASIKEGTSQDILAEYIGHFPSSSVWDGNVALASHNRGENIVHYFEKINELEDDDVIIYTTMLGERKYYVSEVKEIENFDWNDIRKNDNESNRITLITCITDKPDKRLCVIAYEKNI